ncbi:MAG: tetratricopeptide repeat protein [Pseudomonadota bacterium]
MTMLGKIARTLAVASAPVLAGALAANAASPPDREARAERLAEVDPFLEELARPDVADAARVEAEIRRRWAESGSAALDLLYRRGREALEAGETAVAIQHFSAAIEIDPDFAEAWNGRATAFYLRDEYGLAIEDVGVAIQLNPRHWEALFGLGIMLEELGENAAALEAYRRSAAINPHQDRLADAIARLERDIDGQEL